MEEKRSRRTSPGARGRRSYERLLWLVLAGVVVLFTALHFILPDREFSQQENRPLTQLPEFSMSALLDGSWSRDLSDWFADQFPGRDGWLSLRLTLDTLRGSKESGDVYLGRDGYLLEKPVAPSEALPDTLTAMAGFAQAHRDIPMRMLLLPCAGAVLPEKLPGNAPVRDQLADIQAAAEALSGSVTVLQPEFDTTQDIYYRTDHHWTSLGAFQAFQSVAPALGLDGNAVQWTEHSVSHSFQGTLASKSGKNTATDTVTVYEHSPELPYYVIYPDTQEKSGSMFRLDCLEVKDQYTLFFGGNHPVVEVHTTANNGRRLLLFKDSYANCFVQFLTPYYESIILVDPRYCYDSADALLTEYGITEVLYLYSANTLFADTTLADIL